MSTSEPKSPEELREDIARTREELGDTVEALAAKTDVKAQVGAQAEAIKENLQQGAQQAADAVTRRPGAPVAIAAVAGGVLVGWLIKRR